MATENRQNDENATPSLDKRGAARRRLTQVSAGALLTLGSRGALASGPSCLTPSGFWSSGLNPAKSNYGPQTCTGGRSPDYWRSSLGAWPSGIDPATYGFTTAFPMASATACPTATTTSGGSNGAGNAYAYGKSKDTAPPAPTSYQCALLADLLSPQSFDSYQLGMYMAATYLNIQAGLVTFITVATLRQIWNDVSPAGGVFHPTAGVDWTRADVVKYLQATMI